MSTAILKVDRLSKSFGGVQAIEDLSFELRRGEILGLIGPNGSGKSTTVNALAGAYPATSGEIFLAGKHVQSMSEPERVAMGLSRTFQTASVFPEFTVREQVALASHVSRRSHPLSSAFGFGRRGEDEAFAERAAAILEMLGLASVADRRAATLSSAEQRFLMVAMALASEPKVVLLDEPAAGLVAQERKALSGMIRAIRDRGVSVLLIEHHMGLIMEVCDRIAVLNFGAKIAEGTPDEIRLNRAVIDAYLGEAA